MVTRAVRRRTTVAASVVVCILALGACSSGSENDEQAATWCDLMGDVADEMSEAAAEGRPPETDPEVLEAMERVHAHGAPHALEADQARMASGPPPPQTPEFEEYEAAVQRTGSYIEDECGIEESRLQPLLGG